MVTALYIIAYLAMGWLSVFLVEYSAPHTHWDKIALVCCWVLWPVVFVFMGIALAIDNFNPLTAAQNSRARRDKKRQENG